MFAVTQALHTHLFPLLRALGDGRFHSGEVLARAQGISRASVFNAMAQAATLGVRVQAVRGRGYRVVQGMDWLDRVSIAAHLGTLAADLKLECCDSLDSTNRRLLDMAEAGAPDASVCAAEHQVHGKGRRGRVWQSALAGGLTFSVLYRFESGLASLAGLSLAVGLALARALNRRSAYRVLLKWPNDLVVGPRKLGGVLIEVRGDIDGPALAVVGVGLNVRLPADLREQIEQAVIDLDEMQVGVSRNQLLADALAELHATVAHFRQAGFAALRDDWNALDVYAGKPVCLTLGSGEKVCGISAGVDDDGALRLVGSDGTTRRHSGGELSLRAA